jgi:hypothetical protein
MSPFAGYLLGLIVLVAGLAVAAYLLNVPTAAVIVATLVALAAIGAWATRRPRARPSKFTGETTNAPTLDRTVLTELKTTLMERGAGRTQPTTPIPPASDSRGQPTTHVDRQPAVSKRKPPAPDDA